jgi:hypothetical protein
MKEQRILKGMLILILLALAMVVGLTVRLSAHGKAYAQGPESALSAAEGLSTSFTYQEQLRSGSGPVRHTAVINSSVDMDTLDVTLSNAKLQTGHITIAKEAPGGGSTLFYFGGDLGLMALADGYTGTQYNIPAGDYVVTESVPSDWELIDVTCVGGNSDPYSDASGEGVEIHLDAGEHITCTFTNEHQIGNITIAKEAPGGGATLFYFDGDLGLMALADGYTGTQYNIPAGDYVVTESVPSDWELIDVTCVGGDSDPYSDAWGEGVEIHLDAGEHITCTFTNEHQIGNITIAKEAPGGGATLFYFGGDLGLMALADGYTGTQYNIPAGDYVVTESVPSDWFLMDVSCEGGDSTPYGDGSGRGVTIHLVAGEHITCTFTNLQVSGILYLPLVARNYLGALDLVVQSVEATRPVGQALADLSPRSNRAESGK